MKICIPIIENNGLKSKVNAHFGSAPYFLIYDTEKETFEIIDNSDSRHMHGMCHPLKALENKDIHAVVCGGMGARAVQKLNESGIRAYRASVGTVEEIISIDKEGKLEEITMDNACADHSCH
ncbi:MAG: NifB/NifX family molybdenum-iron cluster-binding protein [Candidatus Omnitrophica bacterium]|nr:NifB/NifX family molybdenum-iron cluster-binding protein [Candidatus Omnitrophota bacterium]MBU1925693.1 NifB/NifX family molybdenum-iron cluster-binding protein [Candidatus Omnitrophota bacterium]